jgi:hypothetical protein
MSGAPALLTPANARSIPGSYAIVAGPGTLASKNYTFTFGAAVATVTKAKLTVTPKSLSMTYGSRPPALAYTYCGFLNGDGPQTVSGEPILTSQANSSSPVGVYQIAGSVGTLSSARYTFQMAGGAVTVTKAVLTVSAVSQSTTYGAGVPALGYAVSGLLNGDKQATALTGTPRVSSPATAHSPVGQYAIQISPGTLAAMNYSFQFASGQLTVTKALLKVAANNLSVTVGSTVPGLTYAASGLVNGDTLTSATSGAPALSTSATTSKAGSYPIKTGPGSLSASNYELTFANGTLTVMP